VLRQYEQKKAGTKSLPVMKQIGVGVAAGAFAKFITTPIQQIVTRKQTAAMMAARDPTSSLPPDQVGRLTIKDIALQIRSERGIQGFWAGYSASVILTLNPALTFLLHNLMKKTLLPKSRQDKPGAVLTFLLAALSKAAASTVTYPFSLAKTRAQVSSPSSLTEQPTDTVEKEKEADLPESQSGPASVEAGQNRSSSNEKPAAKVSKQARGVLQLAFQYSTLPPVLRSLAVIYRTEGIAALYSGLSGEVLKGFLGHGLTMLLKERIHLLIVSFYYLCLRTIRHEGGLAGSLGDAREQAFKEMQRVRSAVGEAGEKVAEGAGQAYKSAGEVAQDVGERAGNVGVTISEGVGSAIKGTKE